MDRELQALIVTTVDNARRSIESVAPLVYKARMLAGDGVKPLSYVRTAQMLPRWDSVKLHLFEHAKYIPTEDQLGELLSFVELHGRSN